MSTQPISPEIIEEVYEELEKRGPKAVPEEMDRVFDAQPELYEFLYDASSELSEDATRAALYLVAIACLAFEKALGRRLPVIRYRTLERALHEQLRLYNEVVDAEGTHQEDAALRALEGSQPALTGLAGGLLFGEGGIGANLPEGDREGVFVMVKGAIEALSREVADAAKPRRTGSRSVYQIKVTLKGIRPPIWRRLLVPSDLPFDRLHDVIQIAMGWEDCHLHLFRVGRTIIGQPDRFGDDLFGEPTRNEAEVTLEEVLRKEKDKVLYEYDFGDSWEHEIRLEKVLPPDPGFRHPVCVKGKRACPPEDCGGPWGYANILAALEDPNRPDREELLDWVPEGWDPEAFDPEPMNEELKREFGEEGSTPS